MFKISLQLFLEQLESALQGNESSIRCQWPALLPWNFDSWIFIWLCNFLLPSIMKFCHSWLHLTLICLGCSHDELVIRSRDQSISDYGQWCLIFHIELSLSVSTDKIVLLVVMFFRFVTSGEIQKRSEFFEPFIMGLTNGTVDQVC